MRLLLALFICLVSARVSAADVTVFAAASLKESLDSVAKSFEAATGKKVVVSYAASSALAKQIENGAPADVFISADLEWADYLDERKLLAPGTRSNLLGNQLALIAPTKSSVTIKLVPRVNLAVILGAEKLAMANPVAVPAGKYGKAALESLGAWTAVSPQVARAENVRAALLLVSRGEAPLGIVYRTDALADKGVRVVDIFPATSHPPIVYPVALGALSKSADAKQFLAYMKTAAMRPVWESFGFTVLAN